MSRYRRRPVEVEAIQWTPPAQHAEGASVVCNGAWVVWRMARGRMREGGWFLVGTHSSTRVREGDWIVADGDAARVVSRDDFEADYEPVG